MTSNWPLVGREEELRRLRELIADPQCPGIVVAGPAGVGKTRLALESLAVAEALDFGTARVTATVSTSGLPFGALAPLLPALGAAESVPSAYRAELLRRSADAFVARFGGRRIVLFVDDAQLLDEASATLIHQLALTNSAFVLATVRSGEPVPAPIVALWKDGLLERLELGGLEAERLNDLLTATLGGQIDPATASLLIERCRGNVLFLRELVLGALETGALVRELDVWRLVTRDVSPSDRLVELVEVRLAGLDARERSFLELLSVGEPLGSAELDALADPALAEELEQRRLVTSRLDGRRLQLGLAHPLYGEVLRSRIPALRARRLAESLAELVEKTGARRRGEVLRLASLRLASGGGSADLMLAAATAARWHYDFPLAERLGKAAVDAGAGFDARLLVAQLASLQGRTAEAEEQFAGLAETAADDRERGELTLARLDNRFFGKHPEHALKIAEEAEKTIADPAWRDEITARRAWILTLTHGPREAVAAARPLLEGRQGRVLVTACLSASYGLAHLGEVDAAIDATERGLAAHLTLKEPIQWYPWVNLMQRCDALRAAGRLAEYEELARAQYQEALAERSPEQQAFFAWKLAQLVAERGRVQTAARYAREALAMFRQLGRAMWVQDCVALLALTYALAGNAQAATETIGSLDDFDSPPLMYLEVDLIQARAWTAVAVGDLPLARRHLEEAATLGEDVGDLVGAAAALHAVARLGHARDVVKRLGALAGAIEGDLAPARAAHAEALARRRPEALDDVSTRCEAMGADLLAADAAAHAAVAWRQAGEPRRAAGAERRVAELVDRCEGATTPAINAIGDRALLTPAEREAAILAAAGRSNREIASELFVSVRTVETRLQHVYVKLGVSGRDELAAIFDRRD